MTAIKVDFWGRPADDGDAVTVDMPGSQGKALVATIRAGKAGSGVGRGENRTITYADLAQTYAAAAAGALVNGNTAGAAAYDQASARMRDTAIIVGQIGAVGRAVRTDAPERSRVIAVSDLIDLATAMGNRWSAACLRIGADLAMDMTGQPTLFDAPADPNGSHMVKRAARRSLALGARFNGVQVKRLGARLPAVHMVDYTAGTGRQAADPAALVDVYATKVTPEPFRAVVSSVTPTAPAVEAVDQGAAGTAGNGDQGATVEAPAGDDAGTLARVARRREAVTLAGRQLRAGSYVIDNRGGVTTINRAHTLKGIAGWLIDNGGYPNFASADSVHAAVIGANVCDQPYPHPCGMAHTDASTLGKLPAFSDSAESPAVEAPAREALPFTLPAHLVATYWALTDAGNAAGFKVKTLWVPAGLAQSEKGEWSKEDTVSLQIGTPDNWNTPYQKGKSHVVVSWDSWTDRVRVQPGATLHTIDQVTRYLAGYRDAVANATFGSDGLERAYREVTGLNPYAESLPRRPFSGPAVEAPAGDQVDTVPAPADFTPYAGEIDGCGCTLCSALVAGIDGDQAPAGAARDLLSALADGTHVRTAVPAPASQPAGRRRDPKRRLRALVARNSLAGTVTSADVMANGIVSIKGARLTVDQVSAIMGESYTYLGRFAGIVGHYDRFGPVAAPAVESPAPAIAEQAADDLVAAVDAVVSSVTPAAPAVVPAATAPAPAVETVDQGAEETAGNGDQGATVTLTYAELAPAPAVESPAGDQVDSAGFVTTHGAHGAHVQRVHVTGLGECDGYRFHLAAGVGGRQFRKATGSALLAAGFRQFAVTTPTGTHAVNVALRPGATVADWSPVLATVAGVLGDNIAGDECASCDRVSALAE